MTIANTTPEQRAADALEAIAAGGSAIREGWLDYGRALNEMRSLHDGDTEFGRAVAAAGLDVWPASPLSQRGTAEIKRDVRIAAMWAAAITPDDLRAYMAAHPHVEISARGGFRGLHAAVLRAAKPKDEKPKTAVEKTGPEDEPAHKSPASDATYTAKDLEDAYEKGRLAGIESAKSGRVVDVSTLSMSAQQKLEAAKRQLERQMEKRLQAELDKMMAEYNLTVAREVSERIIEQLPHYQERMEHASEVSKTHRGIFSKQEFKAILACLHPDSRLSVSDEKLAEAFRAFNGKEIPLLPGVETAPKVSPFQNLRDAVMSGRA